MRNKVIFTASFFFAFVLFALFPFGVSWAEDAVVYEDVQGVWRARVVEVLQSEVRVIPGTDVETTYQSLRAEILEGEKQGEVVLVENDYLQLEKGDAFFLNYFLGMDGVALYSVGEPDRRPMLLLVVGVFIASVFLFAGFSGARALLGLVFSFGLILFVLLPLLINGSPPLLTSIGVAAGIVTGAMLITHGWKKHTFVALGAIITVIVVVVLLAESAVLLTQLTGFASEEAALLNLGTRGTLDLSGLLLAAMVIGVLGLLDDVAITQVTAIEEIIAANPALSRREVFTKALRIGREHTAAVINTLALAYAGASLPLLLFFSLSDTSPLLIINREVFAVEIVRTAIGGIGIMAVVPLATLCGVWFLVERQSDSTVSQG